MIDRDLIVKVTRSLAASSIELTPSQGIVVILFDQDDGSMTVHAPENVDKGAVIQTCAEMYACRTPDDEWSIEVDGPAPPAPKGAN